jgi:hypothetical protein
VQNKKFIKCFRCDSNRLVIVNEWISEKLIYSILIRIKWANAYVTIKIYKLAISSNNQWSKIIKLNWNSEWHLKITLKT